MKFYCIVNDERNLSNPDIFQLLKDSVSKAGLEWRVVQSMVEPAPTFRLAKGDILYRLSINARSKLYENLLLNDDVASYYAKSEVSYMRAPWTAAKRMQDAGVRIIPTVYGARLEADALLKEQVKTLGGFPVILKASGGSHGSSVLQIDSISSLKSVLGYVTASDSSNFVLRRFIKNARHLRMIVIDGKVVDTIEYQLQPDDFRTNAVKIPNVKPVKEPKFEALAVCAVQSLGLDFGGVDVLVDGDGVGFIAEVNTPCNFARNQLNTGVAISDIIVDFLMKKSQNITA